MTKNITFSTKARYPFIDTTIAKELHSYLAGICQNNESIPVEIGGVVNHIHILCMLSRKIALMKLVEELKSHSSRWIKTIGAKYQNFIGKTDTEVFRLTRQK